MARILKKGDLVRCLLGLLVLCNHTISMEGRLFDLRWELVDYTQTAALCFDILLSCVQFERVRFWIRSEGFSERECTCVGLTLAGGNVAPVQQLSSDAGRGWIQEPDPLARAAFEFCVSLVNRVRGANKHVPSPAHLSGNQGYETMLGIAIKFGRSGNWFRVFFVFF